jgi:hypothetical protein
MRDDGAKFLLAATPHGVQKQGVRNEITIAIETATRINDKAFIVPLRLALLAKSCWPPRKPASRGFRSNSIAP